MNNLKDVGAIVEEIIEEVINPEQPVDLTWLKTEICIALLAERRGLAELQSFKDQVNLLDSRFDDLVESPLKWKLIEKYMQVENSKQKLPHGHLRLVN